jgi:prepilin-type N-terminal cleavage/methylation domain-containing protein
MTQRNGFTLLELSVVLTIIGLIIGGIMTGQNLLRQSELRSMTNDMQRYHAAILSFRQQYDAVPGDMTTATNFWGVASGACASPLTASGVGTQTCNGDGDGFIGTNVIPGSRYEWFRAWQHLANAKLIEGSFSGISDTNADANAYPGINVPETGIAGVGITAMFVSVTTDTGQWFGDPEYGNVFSLGTIGSGRETRNPFLTAREAFQLDQKLDDGLASSGTLLSRNDPSCAQRPGAGLPAEYLTGDNITGCYLILKLDL